MVDQGLVLCSDHRGGNTVVDFLAEDVVSSSVCITSCGLSILCQYQLLAQAFGIQFGVLEPSGGILRLLP